MASIILADHDNDNVRPAVLNTVTAAKALEGEVHILVAGDGCSKAAEEAAKIDGVAQVLICDDERYTNQLAEEITPLLVELSKAYDAILTSADTFGKNIMPRVAALLDVMQISDIVAVESHDTFVRPIYAGNALASVQTVDEKKVLTVRTTAFDAAPAEGGTASIKKVEPLETNGLSSFLGQELSKSERPELTSARVIISGGRGMQSGDNFPMLEKIADILGAAVGASRAAVDAGFVPNDYQVGQTGKIVAPELYIAVGISGAIQHLAGMKDSKIIVAINKDSEAPIFQIADYGLVGDLFKLIPELEKELERVQ